MKVIVTFKDPDGVHESLRNACEESVEDLDISEDEKRDLAESREDQLNEDLSTWIKYDEYVSIEFDTEKKTATVLKSR